MEKNRIIEIDKVEKSKGIEGYIAKKIKKIRNDAGESQKAFGEKMNYDKTIICKIEAGNRHAKIDDVYNICRNYGTTPNELFGILEKTERDDNENIINIGDMPAELKAAILSIYNYWKQSC